MGAPLYVSAAGSEVVQLELENTCASDVALRLNVLADDGTGAVDRSALMAVTAQLPHTVQPILQETATVSIGLPSEDGASRRGLLVARDGWGTQTGFGAVEHGAVVAQSSTAAVLVLQPGDTVRVGTSATGAGASPLTFAGTVADVPVLPEPPYWCGLRDALRPSGFGDPPPPLLLTATRTVDDLADTGVPVERIWEVGVDDVRTLGDARRVRDGFVRALADHEAALERRLGAAGDGVPPRPNRLRPGTEGMTTVVRRGEALAEAIGRAVAPVRLAGVLSAGSVLMAAAAMLARERQRELRLAALRGVTPGHTAIRLLGAVAPAGAIGSVSGAALAVLALRTLGPTPEIEPAVMLRAGTVAVAAAVVGVLTVAGAAAMVGDRFVDPAPHRHRWRLVPWELPVVVLAALSYDRLRDGGGLRFTGVSSRGGDLLAQALPLLALAAVAVVLARPLRWLAGRVRRSGGTWPLSLRLGWRRAIAEPALATALVAAITVAVGAVVLSGVLSSSASAGMRDKAGVFVGSDLAVSMTGPATVPAGLTDRATVVVRADADVTSVGALSSLTALPGGRATVEVMGVEPGSFTTVARSAGASDLDDLLASIEPDGERALPALVVGAGDTEVGEGTVQLAVRDVPFEIRPVASLAVFPGLRSGAVLIVVDAGALRRAGVDGTDVVWIRDPPTDAVPQLLEAGNVPGVVVRRDDVFDAVSFRAQRWTYDVLAALGVLVGAVVLVLQLLVAESRAQRRRLSHVVLRRTGATARDRWTAAVVEAGVPLAVGGAIGTMAALVVARIAVGQLDPLPSLPPTMRLVVPVGALIAATVLVVVVTSVLAVVTARSETGGDVMEVIRGTA